MADADFQHIQMNMVKDVAVIEIRTKNMHGPTLANELGAELALVTAQEWARRLLVDFRRVGFLSSTGFAVLFKLVSRAKAEGREIKLCAMEPGVRLGAEIVGLDKLVDIHENEHSALAAFAQTWFSRLFKRGGWSGSDQPQGDPSERGWSGSNQPQNLQTAARPSYRSPPL